MPEKNSISSHPFLFSSFSLDTRCLSVCSSLVSVPRRYFVVPSTKQQKEMCKKQSKKQERETNNCLFVILDRRVIFNTRKFPPQAWFSVYNSLKPSQIPRLKSQLILVLVFLNVAIVLLEEWDVLCRAANHPGGHVMWNR